MSDLIITYQKHGNIIMYQMQQSVPAFIVLRRILRHLLYDLPFLSGFLYRVPLHRCIRQGKP